jgi:hypothetical protein
VAQPVEDHLLAQRLEAELGAAGRDRRDYPI